MNQSPFVQSPCVKCGATVWIAPAAGMGYCPSCQTPNQLPAGAGAAPPMGGPPTAAPAYGSPPGASGGYGPPPQPGASGGYGPPPQAGGFGPPPMGGPPMGGPPMGGPPMGGGFPMPAMTTRSGGGFGSGGMLKAIGGGVGTVILVIIIAFAKFGMKSATKSTTSESLSSLGIDEKKGDPDKMIAAARAYALKWKSDAGFWSVNILKLRADGTVDLTNSNVVVEYFSPSAVSSPLQSVRDDSIKKFTFQNGDMDYRIIWGVRKQYKPAPRPTAVPGCTSKALATKLVSMGLLKPGGSVHAQIDPAFGDEWLVQTGSVPKRFDLMSCAEKK